MVWLSVAVLAAIAVTACYYDVAQRRLPNWLCAITLVAGLAVTGLAGDWVQMGMALAHAVLALVIGMALFAVGAIGGGDAKFYAAMAAWFPLGLGVVLLFSVSLCGLALLVVWLGWRLSRRAAPRNKDDVFAKLPYGVAIAIGGLIAFARPLLMA